MICDAADVGFMIPQSAFLGMMGVSAPLAIARMYNAFKRLLNATKNLEKKLLHKPRLVSLVHKLSRNQIDELKDWIQAEINLQKDILETAKKLNKTEGNHLILQRIKASKDKVNHRNNPSNPVSIESLYPL